ncbi:MAG: 23S rRNA (adenine(2503)-C(2))-methyltransferase RlmN [Bradymonadia bacterium]
MNMSTVDLTGTPRQQLAERLPQMGVPAHHALRIFGGLHKRNLPLQAIPDLGHRIQGRLQAHTRQTVLTPAQVQTSSTTETPDGPAEGVEKMLFTLEDGAQIEGVLIPTKPGRFTVCVSSQVGCAMGCTFCATATLGLMRNLTSGEIVAQVHAARRRARELGGQLTNVVFMGMGEPLQAWPAVRDALQVMLDPAGLSLKARHITVSTVGVVPKMAYLTEAFQGRVQLALSLHAGTDETRQQIIPLAKRYPLATLKEALLNYPLRASRMMMLEYVVLPGVNDTDAEIEALGRWGADLKAVVNLIPFNPFPQSPFRAPTDEEVLSASRRMKEAGLLVTVRWPRGRGVDGACGQLALRHESEQGEPAQGASRSAM